MSSPAMEKSAQEIYAKVYTRENCLIAIQIWEEHQIHLLKEAFGQSAPLSIFDAYEGVVRVNYREDTDDVWGKIILDRVAKDPSFVPGLMKRYAEQLDALEGIWKEGAVSSSKDLLNLFTLASQAWVGLSVSYFLPGLEGASEADQELGMKLRERAADFLELTDHVIQNTLHRIYPQLDDLIKYVTIEEVRDEKIPSTEELKKRKTHYIYYDFTLYIDTDINSFIAERDIVIREDVVPQELGELKGQTAMKGKVKGIVRILSKKAEIPLLQEGEILVTAMTTPDYLPAMGKAAAFITDEGGITCHAAIVARELGKPCVIGTKIATQALKDGDEVEVDADSGIVRILNQS